VILPRFATGRSAAGRSDPAGHRTGRRGERLAARRLRRTGHRLLDRNVVLGGHEVDLLVLAPDRRTIVLVEVKTRTGPAISPASSSAGRPRRAESFSP